MSARNRTLEEIELLKRYEDRRERSTVIQTKEEIGKMKLSQWPRKMFTFKGCKTTISENFFLSNWDLPVARYSYSKFDEIQNSQFHNISCPILNSNYFSNISIWQCQICKIIVLFLRNMLLDMLQSTYRGLAVLLTYSEGALQT